MHKVLYTKTNNIYIWNSYVSRITRFQVVSNYYRFAHMLKKLIPIQYLYSLFSIVHQSWCFLCSGYMMLITIVFFLQPTFIFEQSMYWIWCGVSWWKAVSYLYDSCIILQLCYQLLLKFHHFYIGERMILGLYIYICFDII